MLADFVGAVNVVNIVKQEDVNAVKTSKLS